MSFLKSDVAKIVGVVLAAVCAALVLQFPPPNQIGVWAGVVGTILGSLGLVSGGTSGAQPSNVVTKSGPTGPA